MNAAELEALLRQAASASERILWLGALLQRESKQDVVIVGGSAIQVYSNDTYVSGDVDIVGDRNKVIALLEQWGFAKESRFWSHPRLDLLVDPVDSYYNGDSRLLVTVSTRFGPVRLASVEDLIAKRLVEVRVWARGGKELFDQALVLAAEFYERIDWDYVVSVAKRDGAVDLVTELRQRADKLRSRT